MKDILFTVQHNIQLSGSVFQLELVSDEKLPSILPGQFLHIEVPSKDVLLRRPFCIYRSGANFVTIVIERKGKGTESLFNVAIGQKLKVILPLGNGFTLPEQYKKIVLIGGSIGCAPLLSVADYYKDKEFHSFLGFKSKNYVLFEDDFKAVSKTTICTYDGSYGFNGYQIAALERELDKIKPDILLVCGSRSLVRSCKEFSEKHGIPAFMSDEQRMACGIGACLGCTCKIKNAEGHIQNKRVCSDGPVFNIKDIVL